MVHILDSFQLDALRRSSREIAVRYDFCMRFASVFSFHFAHFFSSSFLFKATERCHPAIRSSLSNFHKRSRLVSEDLKLSLYLFVM